jgi:hypothetical protein
VLFGAAHRAARIATGLAAGIGEASRAGASMQAPCGRAGTQFLSPLLL